MFLTTTTEVLAHEKWFHETEGYGLRWDLLFRPLPLAFIGAVLLATLAAWLYWQKRGRGFVPDRKISEPQMIAARLYTV
jgi:hypothetical protein